MNRKNIPINEFLINPNDLWANKWLLLTSGDYKSGKFNTMTVGWGSFGVMWSKPFAQVVVRPTRYTFEFMEQYDSFTLCAFPDEYHKRLLMLGTKSGRYADKIAEAGLNPVASNKVAAPSFSEAELIVECAKMYWNDFDPTHFLDPGIESNYPQKDYHRAYFGEILAVSGIVSYSE